MCYPADLKLLGESTKIFQLSLKLALSILKFQVDYTKKFKSAG